MRDESSHVPSFSSHAPPDGEWIIPFAPPMDPRDIFKAMIADEVRGGRLTPSRRRKIVRYAAPLRLSAVEVGEMIAECRAEWERRDDADECAPVLRLADPEPEPTRAAPRIMIALGLTILIHQIVLRWM